MQQLDTVQNNEWIPTGADIKDTVRVVDTLPLASEAELGKAYLLTGTMTDANGVTFTKTHFYRCVKADNGTGYAWEDMNVGRYTLGNCTNIQIRVYNEGSKLRVILSWNDPVDLVYGENRVHWKETRLVSQIGHMPTSITDGTTIGVFTRRDAQAEFGSYSFKVDKDAGRTHYFKLFPVSLDDAITNDDENGRCAAFNYTAYTAEHPWTSGERQWQKVPVGTAKANNVTYYTKKSDGTYAAATGTIDNPITRNDLYIPTDRVCVYNEMLYVKEKNAATGEWEYKEAMTKQSDGTYTPKSAYFKKGTYYNLNGVSTSDDGSNWYEFTTRAYYKYESAYLNWAGIKQLIRNGTCEQYLPIGTELQVPYHGDYGTMTFEVVDYDTVLPADRSVKHTMTLHAKMLYQWWDLNTGIVFDTYETPAALTKDTARDWDKIYFARINFHRVNGDAIVETNADPSFILDSNGKTRYTGKFNVGVIKNCTSRTLNASDPRAPSNWRSETSDTTNTNNNAWFSFYETVCDDTHTSPFEGDPSWNNTSYYECELPWATVCMRRALVDKPRDPGFIMPYGSQIPMSSPPHYRNAFKTRDLLEMHATSDVYGNENTYDAAYYYKLTTRDWYDDKATYYKKTVTESGSTEYTKDTAITDSKTFKDAVSSPEGRYEKRQPVKPGFNGGGVWHWTYLGQNYPSTTHTGWFKFDWLYRGHDPLYRDIMLQYVLQGSMGSSGLKSRLPRNNGYADRFDYVVPNYSWGDAVDSNNRTDSYPYLEYMKYYCKSDFTITCSTTQNATAAASQYNVYQSIRDCSADLYAIRVSLEAWRPIASGLSGAAAIDESHPAYGCYRYNGQTTDVRSLRLEEFASKFMRTPTADRVFLRHKRYWKLSFIPAPADHAVDIRENWYYRPIDGSFTMRIDENNNPIGVALDTNKDHRTFYPHGDVRAAKRHYMRRFIPNTGTGNTYKATWVNDGGSPLYIGRWTRIFDEIFIHDDTKGYIPTKDTSFQAGTVYYARVGAIYERLHGDDPTQSSYGYYQPRHRISRRYIDYIIGTPIKDVLYTPHTRIPILNESPYLIHQCDVWTKQDGANASFDTSRTYCKAESVGDSDTFDPDSHYAIPFGDSHWLYESGIGPETWGSRPANLVKMVPFAATVSNWYANKASLYCFMLHQDVDDGTLNLKGLTFWTCDGKSPITSPACNGTNYNAWMQQDSANASFDASREYYTAESVSSDEDFDSTARYATPDGSNHWLNESSINSETWTTSKPANLKKMVRFSATADNWAANKDSLYCFMFRQSGFSSTPGSATWTIAGELVPNANTDVTVGNTTYKTDYCVFYEGAFVQSDYPALDPDRHTAGAKLLIANVDNISKLETVPIFEGFLRRMRTVRPLNGEYSEANYELKFRDDKVYYYVAAGMATTTTAVPSTKRLMFPVNSPTVVNTDTQFNVCTATNRDEINAAATAGKYLVYVIGALVPGCAWSDQTNKTGTMYMALSDRYMPDRNYFRAKNLCMLPYTREQMNTGADNGPNYYNVDRIGVAGDWYVNGKVFNVMSEYTGTPGDAYELAPRSHICRLFWKKPNLERIGYGNHVWAQSNIRLYMNGPFDESARYIVANDPTFIQNRHYYSYDTTRREYYKLTDGGTGGSNTTTSYKRGSTLSSWREANPDHEIYFQITGGMPVGFKLDPNSPRSNWEFGCSPCQQYKYVGNKWQPVFADTDYWWKAQPSVNNGLIYDRLAEMYWPNAIIKDGTFGVTDGDKTIKFSQTGTHATRSGTANTFSTAPINGYTGMAANGSGVINISGGRRIPMQSFLHGFLDCEYFRTNDQTWVDGKTYYFKSPYGIYEEADTSNLKAGLGSTPYSNCLYERNPNYLTDIKEAYEFLSGIVPVINFNGMYGNRDNLDYYHASGNGTTTVDKVWLMSVAQVAGGDWANAGVYENVLENAELTALGKYNSYKYALKRFRICGNHPGEMGFSSLNASRIKYNITLAAHAAGGYADSTTAAQYWWLRSVYLLYDWLYYFPNCNCN